MLRGWCWSEEEEQSGGGLVTGLVVVVLVAVREDWVLEVLARR